MGETIVEVRKIAALQFTYKTGLSHVSIEGRIRRELVNWSDRSCAVGWCKDNMSGMEDVKEHEHVDRDVPEEKSMPSSQQEEEVIKKKYGGIMPRKPPLISKDHERAYFDSADWALGKVLLCLQLHHLI
ncbi:hypothetical protein F0562_005443 [Nyssa sinensis]|uniref:cAMP-regulated phosphoprotein 19-related protein n=1 Tax=Nyssa sinensis TaxID=561372 RepID=A0A5J5AHW5_9ASTE|nr:hypothetical protein F0562_005443 [Nyssa sinensis]